MISTDELRTLLTQDGAVIDTNDDKIGKIGQVYLDDESGQPEWVTVKTGFFGTSESFVPLRDGAISGQDIRVPFEKSKVKDAPRMDDAEGHLSPDQEAELYRFYGLEHTGVRPDTTQEPGLAARSETASGTETGIETGTAAGTETGTETVLETGTEPGPRPTGRDTSGPVTDDAMTRSEERLNVGTESVSAGKARLRKYVVTENVTQTVPVSREEVRVEREPITDENRGQALAGGDLTSEEHEVTLSEDQVVVEKEAVPVERVRLDKDTVAEDRQVDEQVAHEEIDLDDADARGRSKGSRSG